MRKVPAAKPHTRLPQQIKTFGQRLDAILFIYRWSKVDPPVRVGFDRNWQFFLGFHSQTLKLFVEALS